MRSFRRAEAFGEPRLPVRRLDDNGISHAPVQSIDRIVDVHRHEIALAVDECPQISDARRHLPKFSGRGQSSGLLDQPAATPTRSNRG